MICRSSSQLERNIPNDFANALIHWQSDGLQTIFHAIWQGYCDLFADPDTDLCWNNENQITQRMIRRIRGKFWPEGCALHIDTQSGVEETRKSKYGLPPTPDVTISSLDSMQISELHIEAKIIRHDTDTGPYLKEIAENFCTGRYCPRSSIGGLFAYHQGDVSTFARHISEKTCISLIQLSQFSPHQHFISEHIRSGLHVKINSTTIALHHFIMPILR